MNRQNLLSATEIQQGRRSLLAVGIELFFPLPNSLKIMVTN